MNPLSIFHSAWFEPAFIGSIFTAVGLLKTYGLCRGIIGGRDKPFAQYACGMCPTWMGNSWRGRLLRYGMPLLFLGIGLWNLGRLALALCR